MQGSEGKERISGTCKWFHKNKGYGFITGQDGVEYFIHYKSIKGVGFKEIEEGQKVIFEKGETPKGPVAFNLEVKYAGD